MGSAGVADQGGPRRRLPHHACVAQPHRRPRRLGQLGHPACRLAPPLRREPVPSPYSGRCAKWRLPPALDDVDTVPPLPEDDPEGGQIVRDENGEPTGIFIGATSSVPVMFRGARELSEDVKPHPSRRTAVDNAAWLVEEHLPPLSEDELNEALQLAITECNRYTRRRPPALRTPTLLTSVWTCSFRMRRFLQAGPGGRARRRRGRCHHRSLQSVCYPYRTACGTGQPC